MPLPQRLSKDVLPAAPADARAFRDLMGLFTTGVCVVSVCGDEAESEAGDRAIAAMTVNSLVSVSLDPMLLCWSIQNTSSQFDQFSKAPRFAVSILGEGQRELAQRYAARGAHLLEAEDFTHSASGLPIVRDAMGFLECDGWSLYPAGDHTMIFGAVTGLGQFEEQPPLGFFSGRFCRVELPR